MTLKIYTQAEYDKLDTDERQVNGKRFDMALAADRREAVLKSMEALKGAVGEGFEFKVEMIARTLGTNVLFSRWIASETIHAASIMGFTRVAGARDFSIFRT